MLSEIGSKDKKDLSGGEDEDSLYYEDLIRQNAAATFGGECVSPNSGNFLLINWCAAGFDTVCHV